MLDVKGRRVVVVGLGASGIAAARLCARRGARVVGTDAKAEGELSAAALALRAEGVELAVGGHERAELTRADLVVVSPGVPSFAELEAAERAGVEIVGEVELACRALAVPAPIVAIGGTNGKSTVTSLIGAIFEGCGKRTFTGGNLGEPLSHHADERWDVVVLEVSSFQMERVRAFRPRASLLLNVTPDHLDRYPSLEAYARAKGNAFQRQTAEDVAIIPHGDAACFAEARRGGARVVTFGPGGEVDVTDAEVRDAVRAARYPRALFGIQGGHNALNVAAAIAACADMGVASDAIARTVREFRGLPHRMALVREIGGVRYYDDSKGTNVGASVTALRGVEEEKCVLIAGGRDKGGSYAPLVEALGERGRGAVVLGEAADEIARAIGEAIPVRRASSMDEAVRVSAELARSGDAVLLSPACSSYDMFRDYKHRGDEFVRAVNDLASRKPANRKPAGEGR
jgi:UDP-N-acetylmuramoylalanine--D-glutamate ligase